VDLLIVELKKSYHQHCKAYVLTNVDWDFFFTSSKFIPMQLQDRCENTDRKSKDFERNAEKGRGYKS